MKLLDYVFYRAFNFYKRKRDSTPIFSGCLITSLTLYLTVLIILELGFEFSLGYHIEIEVLGMFSILGLIWFRYRNEDRVLALELRYKAEPLKVKRIKGWLLSIYIATVLLIPVSIGYMRHNLGWNF